MKQDKEDVGNGILQASKKRKRERPLIEKLPSADGGYNCKFARALGSVDWHTREQGLHALSVWLARNEVSDDDLTKIWKALYFCFWHSDKAPVQAELADRLAAILPQLSDQGALQYFKIFARTMQREWFGIDKLRLDKFMMLARKLLHQVYIHLQETGWSPEATAAYSSFLREEVLAPSDADPSAGFSLHVADIIVQELQSACEDAPVPAPALQALLEPCCVSLARTKRAALLSRLQDGVFEPLLEGGQEGALAELDTQQLATWLFSLGAQEGVKAKNRQICYSLSRALEKMSSKGPRMEAKGGQLQPNQQMNSVMKKSAQPSSDAVLHHSGGNRVPQAAPAAQKAVPALNTSKTQKTAVRARAGEALPGQSRGLSSMGTPQQPDSAKAKLKKLHAKPSQHPAGHASASGGASIPQTAPPPTLGGPEAGSGKTSQKSGRLRAQKEAAQLVNTDLNGQPGGSASSAPPMPSVQPAGNGVSAKKLERDRGQSLPNGRPAAVDVPQRAMMCAQKHTLAGEGGSPLRVTLQAAQGNGAASAGDGLTDSQRKKVKFALKRNLYFAKGGPVPPADVRTPPTAKPKGSALKRPSMLPMGNSDKVCRSPKSIPRAKAALFS